MRMLLACIGGLGLLLSALALAQTDTEPNEIQDDPAVEEEALDHLESEDEIDPLAELAAQEEALAAEAAEEQLDQDGFGEAQLETVLDRFDPSEKISEDKSVSFPNDI